jgi:Glucodextranase, domain B/Beta-propeller repeat
MHRLRSSLRLAGFLSLAVLATSSEVSLAQNAPRAGARFAATSANAAAPPSRAANAYGSLPLSFEANEGQTNASVKYLAQAEGYTVFLTDREAVIVRRQQCKESPFLAKLDAKSRNELVGRKIGRMLLQRDQVCKSHALRIAIDGAAANARLEPLQQLPGKANYLVGADRSKWRTGIPSYSQVRYKGIRPGVDLTYYGNGRQLEFDLALSPGADPNEIALKFPGEERLSFTRTGDVRIGSTRDGLLLRRPSIYQYEAGREQRVEGEFVRLAQARIGIRVGSYNRSEPLIIDPVLAYSSFIGGTDGDTAAEGIAVDSSGNVYLAGSTSATTFPITGGQSRSHADSANYVAFVVKLDPSGSTVLWSTYLGGSGSDAAYGLAIDSNRNVYITGYSMSADFPVVKGFQGRNNNLAEGNVFVARIDTTKTGAASLVYSTYLGGGGNSLNTSGLWAYLGDFGLGIAADSSGRAYVTGVTTSDTSVAPFPTTVSAYQSSLASPNGNAFLSVIDTNQSGARSLVYSTYLGGNSPGWAGDYGAGIVVGQSGDAYISGETTSNADGPFPTTPNAYQSTLQGSGGNAFLTEIDTAKSGPRSLVYSTYLGGSTSSYLGDGAAGVALDSAGKVYIAGGATSSDFPVTAGAFQSANSVNGKAFVAKFDLAQAGTQSLVYSTLLGGTNSTYIDSANCIGVDASGNAFVAGYASSTDFPTTWDAFQPALQSNGGWDAFLTELDPTGSGTLYSTYLGGSTYFGGFAAAISLDSIGNAYVTGYTQSSDFPTTAAAFQTTGALNPDSGFVTKFAFNSSPGITASVSAQPNASEWYNAPVSITFTCIPGAAPIQTCPLPVSVNVDGENQTFSGTTFDTAGNSATASLTVNLDTTSPYVNITSPTSGTFVASSPLNTTGTVTDSLSGIASVTCNGVSATIAVSAYSCRVPLIGGSNTIQVTATDRAGNTSTATARVNLDTTAPTVTIASPANNASETSSPVTVTGTVSDSLSGVGGVICNGVSATITDSRYSCSVSLVSGSNPILVTATDRAGHTSTDSITVNLGIQAPVRMPTAPLRIATTGTGETKTSGTRISKTVGVTLFFGEVPSPSLSGRQGTDREHQCSGDASSNGDNSPKQHEENCGKEKK